MWIFELGANIVQIIVGLKITYEAGKAANAKWREKQSAKEQERSEKKTDDLD